LSISTIRQAVCYKTAITEMFILKKFSNINKCGDGRFVKGKTWLVDP
jgi:hypothetical protein